MAIAVEIFTHPLRSVNRSGIGGGPSKRLPDVFSNGSFRVNPTARTPQVAAVPEGTMSNTEQKSEETGRHEPSERTDRPAGTVDEDANPPLTDETKTDVDRNPKTVPPQDTGSAAPPYEGRT
jgi:hypothetical protein